MSRLQYWGGIAVVLLGGAIAPGAIADEFPPCDPPEASEYLLLVPGETVQARDRIQNLLPTTTDVSVCRYLDDTVVRAGGFTSLENANAWAQYLTQVEGAQAFVARPAAPGELVSETPLAAEPVPVEPEPAVTVDAADESADESAGPAAAPETAPTVSLAAEVGYAPQLLGEGYAVLVDYGNDPTVAKQLQQLLDQPIGLAVYEQRPFLLAVQSRDAQVAAEVLQTLSHERFGAFIVDSSDVVMVSAAVAIP